MAEARIPRMAIRALHTFDEFRQVMALESEIWGYDDPEDAVGIPMFVITLKRGGILLGAFDGDRLVAFVYSIAGIKDGRAMQWSHMLGVLPDYRGSGVGRELKLEQRRLSIEMGLDLMEWTYDPLQTVNAHLNFRRLGVVVEDYVENVYGASSSVLHRGNPTDRFIAQWWMRTPRVEQAIAARDETAAGALTWREGWDRALAVNVATRRDRWIACEGVTLDADEPWLTVGVPDGFTEMLIGDPRLAESWRLATRNLFNHYLHRGYAVVDFERHADRQRGRYLLTNTRSRS
jgi:predicted GNAT superfamily acetyltransferase